MTDAAVSEILDVLSPECRDAAQALNRSCACLALDHARLETALADGGDSLLPDLMASRPHLFSDSVVFVAEAHLQRMAELAQAVETVVAMPAYRDRVLAYAPTNARYTPRAAGAFLGYDYHLDDRGPQLIEINTNAGGGLLNTKLLAAQRACCAPAGTGGYDAAAVEDDFVKMFREEWQLERGDAPLRRIVIVDEAPASQYLAPEFELFRRLFVSHGIAAAIADPGELAYADGQLRHAGEVVDLVYNRLTDFSLATPASAPLAAAYLAGHVVVTPHPQAHALYADKRNLTLLSNEAWLRDVEVPEVTRRVLLDCIPRTVEVRPEAAEAFWASRKQWFFKPAAGFGSRAAYRGDKMTRRVFEEVVAGGYVAQALVHPSERRVHRAGEVRDLKLDLRTYVYRGRVQLAAARLYQGQTTNFRTPGGGFAAVFPVDCPPGAVPA